MDGPKQVYDKIKFNMLKMLSTNEDTTTSIINYKKIVGINIINYDVRKTHVEYFERFFPEKWFRASSDRFF